MISEIFIFCNAFCASNTPAPPHAYPLAAEDDKVDQPHRCGKINEGEKSPYTNSIHVYIYV